MTWLPKDRDIAMVFQNYALYPFLSVYDNLAFGLKLRRTPKPEIDRRVRAAADVLGLEPYLKRKPRALSGGQRQRVAVGRAMVRQPKAFLFDEPLSNLDAQMRGGHAHGAGEAARPARRHHDLRDARPDGGNDDGRPDLCPPGRRYPASRRAARDLSPPGQPLRRRLHRQPAHESFPRLDPAGRRPAGLCDRLCRRACRLCPGDPAGEAARPRPGAAAAPGPPAGPSASGPRMCGSRREPPRPPSRRWSRSPSPWAGPRPIFISGWPAPWPASPACARMTPICRPAGFRREFDLARAHLFDAATEQVL